MKHFFKTYRYELIAALAGAVVMMLELVGARMVAPYFGTSMYVWTAMIGVILGSLSVGYWYGGKLADSRADDRGLAILLGSAALLIGVSVLTQESLLGLIASMNMDVRLQSILAAVVLFAPASCLLGVISPYVVKLRLSSLSTAGSSVGQLYAASTAGSIVGTFASGYWLISWFGNYTLGIMLILLLIAVSFIAEHRFWRWQRLALAGVAVLMLITPRALPVGILADVDSIYSRYRVNESSQGSVLIRTLLTDNRGAQSGYAVGMPDEIVFDYIRGFKQAADAYGPMRDTLMIGGGVYTFPGLIARQNPVTQVDVVEIDPKSDELAKQYFDFRPGQNIAITHADGRVFLNNNDRKYDMIFVDAFSSLSPPYQLATIEASQQLKRSLDPDGAVVANVIARPQPDDAYFAATYHTYRQVFASVKVYRVQSTASTERQNLLFVMGSQQSGERIAERMKRYPEADYPKDGMILRDDHAPVDQLINASES